MTRNKISVIVPFYNEKHICQNYKRLKTILKKNKLNYELILVSDGSTDNIHRKLKTIINNDQKTLLITYVKNQGRGYAVTQGFKNSKGDYLAYIDADLEISPNYLITIYEKLQKFDFVTTSKYHPQSIVKSPFKRKISSYIFNYFVRFIMGSKITDHQIGLKGFRRKVIESLLPKVSEKRWLFDVELLYLAQKAGFNYKEIPVKFTYGYSKIRSSFIYDFIKLFFMMFIIRYRHNKVK